MKFSGITQGQQLLRDRALGKEASLPGAIAKGVAKLPFKAMGSVIKAPLHVASKGVMGVSRAGWSMAQKGGRRLGGKGVMGKALAPVLFGAGALGTVAAGKAAVGKTKEWNRGFDPRLMESSRRAM